MKPAMTMNNEDSGLGPLHLRENSLAELTVARISDMGAFLDAGTGTTSDDILLHHSQQTRPAPVMLTTRFGAFIDVGTERGIFLPFSQMEERVETGQYVWVKMYVDKTGRLAVTMKVNEDIRSIALPAKGVKVGDMVTGTVYNKTGDGVFLITRERWIAFLHRDEINKPIHMGDEITGRVAFLRKDGHMNISLRPQKEKSIEGDMQLLLEYMNRHNGSLPFTDQSDPALIRASLGISKAAFKRAVGHLLKLKKISMKEGKITLS